MSATCYMCDRISVGREHAPPLCFFPEYGEIGRDLRRNLITVDSCAEHNLGKSLDDEYLLYVLVACQEVNPTAEELFSTKIMRAISRRPALMNQLLADSSLSLVLDPKDGQWHETRKVTINEERFYRTLERLACALYYHHFRRKWRAQVHVVPEFLKRVDDAARIVNRSVETIRAAAAQLLSSAPSHGENTEVFYYQVYAEPATGVTVMRLVFYGGARVTVMFVPPSSNKE